MNPILRRELLEVLRTRKAVAAQVGLAAATSLLVVVRWPSDGVTDLTGARAQQVLQVFGYGLLAGVLFLVPAFPATAIVRERNRGTLALLLNTPMTPRAIYAGKLLGVLGFAALLLAATVPAAAACYALGGTASRGGVGLLYAVLAAAVVQVATLGLLVSGWAQSTDAALRTTYAVVLAGSVLPLAPHWMVRGDTGPLADAADWLRCVSPVPAVLEILGHGGVGTQGLAESGGTVPKYFLLAGLTSLGFAAAAVARLTRSPLDRSRAAGVMTEDRGAAARAARRVFFLIDPQRRSRPMSGWANPVMVKEFRSRRFGRSHWTLRLVAGCGIVSLGLSLLALSGALAWGVEAIGGALVLLQTALLVLFAPSLAAGLISGEREGGGWTLLRTTPLTPGAILRGKLLSVVFPLLLLLCGTLPGYLVVMTVKPELAPQVGRVVACLAVTAGFAVLLSAAASSLFASTAAATGAANLALLAVCVGPLLVWLGRDAPFGHAVVETALTVSPVAAALASAGTPGFADYDLVPANWWLIGAAGLALLAVLVLRTRRLTRPD